MVSMKYMLLVAIAIPLIAVLGYFAMQSLFYMPLEEYNTLSLGLVALAVTLLGLCIPYWMLKVGFFDAHLYDSRERTLKLNDFPKDKQQIAREHPGRQNR